MNRSSQHGAGGPASERGTNRQGRSDARTDRAELAGPIRLSGFWSRRIDDEHRLVYGATDNELIIIQARYHYDG